MQPLKVGKGLLLQFLLDRFQIGQTVAKYRAPLVIQAILSV